MKNSNQKIKAKIPKMSLSLFLLFLSVIFVSGCVFNVDDDDGTPNTIINTDDKPDTIINNEDEPDTIIYNDNEPNTIINTTTIRERETIIVPINNS
jgi:hypothetical protein